MSSKNGPESSAPRAGSITTPIAASDAPKRVVASPWSLAARLTAWYAGSAFLLILAATAFLYWTLANSLDREDDEHLGDRVRLLRALVEERPNDREALKREV